MNVVLPKIGEDVNEATVSFWHINKGEKINKGDDLVEMVTDKAAFNVPSPASGVLTKVMFEEGQTAKVGQTIAIIEEK